MRYKIIYTFLSNTVKLVHYIRILAYQSDFADLDNGSIADATDLIPQGPVALVEEAARKREVRLLKNREAARECRRKKKEYIKCLENRVQPEFEKYSITELFLFDFCSISICRILELCV